MSALFFTAFYVFAVLLAALAVGRAFAPARLAPDDLLEPRRNDRQVSGLPRSLHWVERNLFKRLPRFA